MCDDASGIIADIEALPCLHQLSAIADCVAIWLSISMQGPVQAPLLGARQLIARANGQRAAPLPA